MRLLIVEDDRKVAGFLEQGFIEERFEVDLAHDGHQAIALALAARYDLILMDFMLPGRSGPEVVAELRQAGQTTPVLMLTARDDPRDVRAAMDAGADGYVTKPFRFADLLHRVATLLTDRRRSA
jgi:DNA-binding response OmpR family regulator